MGGDITQIRAAELPNIEGEITGTAVYGLVGSDAIHSGAFDVGTASMRAFSGGGGGYLTTLKFDASKSNNVYGTSNTVQPPAITLIPQVKI